MEIYLARPGAKKLGPFTLSRINKDLAERKYRDTDYWAWCEGLPEWVPLYAVPGVVCPTEPPSDTTRMLRGTAVPNEPTLESSEPEAVPAASAPVPEPAPADLQLASGMPLAALRHIFLLTNGDGRTAMHSPLSERIIAEAASAEFQVVRQSVPRDVIGGCPVVEQLRRDGAVPDAAWRAMAGLKPGIVQQAREGAYRICVRTFPLSQQQSAALFLFYDKRMLDEK